MAKYGLDEVSYLALYDRQNGRCAICLEPFTSLIGRVIHVDHDHVAGHVRGLLCGTCNTGLGQFKDSTELLRRAAVYLDADRFHRTNDRLLADQKE